MGWYYDDESVSNYYQWYKQDKLLARARKKKEKLEAKREEKKKKEALRILARKEKLERIRKERQELKQKKKELLMELKTVGYRPRYTRKNPLKRDKKSRDLNLCREIYEKAKSGMSTFALAKEYDLHPNTILRHKYEYQYYLGLKGIDKEINL